MGIWVGSWLNQYEFTTKNLLDVKMKLEEFAASCEQDLENCTKHLYSLRRTTSPVGAQKNRP